MTQLTFYGGVGEIGGNKILLEAEGKKIFFDFGKNFARERKYYEEPYLSPRDEKHLLALGMIPPIEGLYKKDDREHDIDAFFISHPHTDHCDYVRYAKDDIPIYCGEGTQKIITARDFSGRVPSDYQIANLTQSRGREVFKKFIAFHSGDTFNIGSVEVEPIHVDHSVPAAYGCIVHTPDGCIAYTGDFRLHGPKQEMSKEFIEKAKESEPDALIIEGTNIVESRLSSESDVKRRSSQIISTASHLVLVGLSAVDIDRLRTFYELAIESKRKLVISMKQAFLLGELKHLNLEIFDLSDPNVLIFMRKKKTTYEWEKLILQRYPNVVNASDLSERQSEIILVASFYDMNEMIEIRPKPGRRWK